jgi:NAD(P)-dependent dehydrogenase (short-subunit alcohol dehydrogenase family)
VVVPGLVLTAAVREGLPEEFSRSGLRAWRGPRLGDPADVAAAVGYLLSDDVEWVVGQVLGIDGGATLALRPRQGRQAEEPSSSGCIRR